MSSTTLSFTSRTARRMAAVVGATVLAMGVGAGAATQAQAQPQAQPQAQVQAYEPIVYTMSYAEVAEKKRTIEAGTFACGLFGTPLMGAACALSSSTMREELNRAYYNDCGLKVIATPTGSSMSYDKVTYDYALAC